jgi:A/G-specific adenine glycosylase
MSKPADGQDDSNPGAMRTALMAWYAQHKRPLPWRRDRDAYRVWVSEIMLQQTRVAAVLEHYRAFLEAFPTVEALAGAAEEQVLARWSGLGYYRRARMLHQAARVVVKELGGVIPRTEAELRKLPGIGRYTAAAIASIAYGEPVAVVDGNVERVLIRLDGEPRSGALAWRRAQELLDGLHAGDWNQAMMELGATVCTPQNPQCPTCPVGSWCRAPGAATGRPRGARQRVQIVRALIERKLRMHKHCVYLVQRPADAAKMAGMWELPECAGPAAGQDAREVCMVRHSITDTDYEVRVVRLGLRALGAGKKTAGRWVIADEVFELPLTGLTRKILRAQRLLPDGVVQSGSQLTN